MQTAVFGEACIGDREMGVASIRRRGQWVESTKDAS